MKKLLPIFLLLTAQVVDAQQPVKTLLTQVKKGFCDEDSKRCIKQQFDYLNACEKLGDYYFKLKKYKAAFKYYELPLELEGHSTNFQTDAAWQLRNKIIAKAGDMLFFGKGFPKDTIYSLHYHLQFPLNYGYKKKYSLLYLRTIQDTFNLPATDTLKNSFLIAINRFMLTDSGVVKKVADFINKHIPASNNLRITITWGGIPITLYGQLILNRQLRQLKELLEQEGGKRTIETAINFDDNNPQKIINGRSLPILIISSI